MNTEQNSDKSEKVLRIGSVMHRLFRVIVAPLIILTVMQMVFCFIISIPLWVLTGKTTIIHWSCDLMAKHVTYVLDGA